MKVIVADDEAFVRRGIIENIDWHALDIDEVFEAHNGEKCLEKMQKHPVDILIADIRMPKLNGVALGKAVSGLYPDCRIIFISAYTDKAYFKSAIGLNVVAYVEKPISIAELTAAIGKAAQQVQAKRNRSEMNNLTQVLRAELTGGSVPAAYDALVRQRQTCGYCVSLVRIRTREGDVCEFDADAMKAVFSLQELNAYLFGDILRLEYVVIAEAEHPDHIVERCVLALTEYIRTHGARDLFVSVGSAETGTANIHKSFREARDHLSSLFFKGYGAMAQSSAHPKVRREYTLSTTLYEAFRQAIINRVESSFTETLAAMRAQLETDLYTENSAKSAAIKIVNLFSTLGWREKVDLPDIEYLMHCETLDEVLEFLREQSGELFKFGKITDEVVLGALHIISQEYGNQALSISYICQTLGVSKSKMCSIFRSETGMSINEYVNSYRMIAAKEYIREGALSLKDIARLTGFNDINYFSKVFKRFTGQPPSVYKERTQ